MIKKNDYDIDVVVPVYNGEKFIKECLESILSQTYPVNKIFVVDDSSTDNTKSIISKLAKKHKSLVYISIKHSGLPAARNAGIVACQAPYIAFLDADDVWHRNKLEEQIIIFKESGPNLALVYCAYELIDEENLIENYHVAIPEKRGNLFEAILFERYGLSGSASAVLIKRVHLDKVGYFDDSLSFAEDFDMWLKLSKEFEFDFSPKCLLKIRIHSSSMQRKDFKRKKLSNLFQTIKILNKHSSDIHKYPEKFQHIKFALRHQLSLFFLQSLIDLPYLKRNLSLLLGNELYKNKLFFTDRLDFVASTFSLFIKTNYYLFYAVPRDKILGFISKLFSNFKNKKRV